MLELTGGTEVDKLEMGGIYGGEKDVFGLEIAVNDL